MNTVIIANPTSGSYNKELLESCASVLRKRFGDVSIEHTKAPNEAGKIARSANADLVIAAGGDGLINEVAAGMVGKTNTLFTALPFGTVNVFCREFKIPLNPLKAAERFNPDSTKLIPIGFLGDRPFVLMCGFGYDADVVRSVVAKKYKKHKTLAHIKEGILSLNNSYPRLTVYINGKEIHAYHIIISLGHLYAGNFSLSNSIKDNKLNVFLQGGNKMGSLLYSTFTMAMGGGFPTAPIYADSMKVVGTNHAQADGEYIDTEIIQNYVHIQKSALRIIM
ncbi:MAG: hypothetical protein LBV09_07430 [Deferribacteraceae bacterium]|jgi:diacylglycerol kinase family enzyme|nr:hypothetical protein [Deferribacteraceae bacterium]